uniref:RNA-dependent RNA polymerase n=1 Tax=Panagrolaimus sp. PS1159 TaxID=55785 RepID=A0AC35EYX0_9BILA
PCNTYIKRRFYEPNLLEYPKLLPEDLQKLKNGDEWYPLLYAVQALTSRGGEISITKTVRALELMLDRIDSLLDLPEPIGLFNQFYDNQPDYESACELIQLLLADGYTRIRKVVCTPTRTLLFNPEMIMANRCIRASKSDNFLFVLFRDDKGSKLFGTQRTLVYNTVGNFLKESKIFGMRTFSYLGSSDSQMRDHGCFLMAGTHEEVKQFKNTFGDFATESIQKSMINFGQFLTQSWSIPLDPVEYWEMMDYVSGINPNNEPYIFTDGVGIMSKDFAKDIATALGYSDYTPSCVQIKYLGYMGLLVLDVCDVIGEYYEAEQDITKGQRPKIIFRSSQKLFETDAKTHPHFVEVLRVSFPTSVTLNKPMINILDQVSEAQDAEIHANVKNRIFELLDNNIEDITSTLIDNKSACAALNDYQKLIPSELFGQFNVTEEPFFRSMLRSSALIRLQQLNDKMKIKIPSTKSRMMFGCIDESGLLESGQVYIRFTNNIDTNFPVRASERTTLTGRVMITKQSATVPGDVRLFEAVDVEGLADLVDVVVFSSDGERPNHNEICGFDFAEEAKFTVIWDPELFIHHNEVPFTYIPPSPHVAELSASIENTSTATELPEAKKDFELMADLFKNYVSDDCVGLFSNAHLANSDLYGIFSDTCSNLSQKLYQAHNFQQSGIKPIPLTKESSNGMPPERVERYPN